MSIEKKEIFAAHKNYSKYIISNMGYIINKKTGRILKPCIINKGYLSLELFRDSIKRGITVKLHRIIAETFLDKVDGFVIDHIDNNKLNNSIFNLQYVSNRYNVVKQRLFSKNGFIRKIEKSGIVKFVLEFRLGDKRVYYSSNNEIDCVIYYCNSMINLDTSVINLLKNFYKF